MGRRRTYRRSSRPSFRRRHGLTPLRIMKWGIALTPAISRAAVAYKVAGGDTDAMKGLSDGFLPSLSKSYTGFNTLTGKWGLGDMMWGYAPLVGAWLFGKAASRVLR